VTRKTRTRLADGRELIYYGMASEERDTRHLDPTATASRARYDPVLDEWVLIAGHRQARTHLPPDTECPLCPSRDGHLTEIPARDYDVVVFENRFPALAPQETKEAGDEGVFRSRDGDGRCEVVSFSPDHDKSFRDLSPAQARLVLDAWTDRTAELSGRPGIRQVYCFENRGPEIGVTLSHPHGQIYAYPFLTPRTYRMLTTARGYRHRTGRDLFADVLAAERSDGSRVVLSGRHWTAFVPFAARWPYEVHLYPHRRMPDLPALLDDEKQEFCELYLDLLRRFDLLFGVPAPYISAWHQAPVRQGRQEFALHLELFTIRRAPGKLKYLAGSESGMGAFTNDVAPETAAATLREKL
jgi:UDPglucose--hexose-1-phosphate uridylyltransferase